MKAKDRTFQILGILTNISIFVASWIGYGFHNISDILSTLLCIVMLSVLFYAAYIVSNDTKEGNNNDENRNI